MKPGPVKAGLFDNKQITSPAWLQWFTELNSALEVIGDQQAHIVDADGTLADLTTKFNTLLSHLRTHGLIASS